MWIAIFVDILAGVWLASADGSMVIAIYNTISSDFDRFQDAMWILAAYHLGLAPAQPLVREDFPNGPFLVFIAVPNEFKADEKCSMAS